jgi:hypothetical protein
MTSLAYCALSSTSRTAVQKYRRCGSMPNSPPPRFHHPVSAIAQTSHAPEAQSH